MRTNYPVLSKEVNDMFQDLYYKLVFLLGYAEGDEPKTYQGKYDELESTIQTLTNSIILQETDASLVYQSQAGSIPLYDVWGTYIVINELRSL